jgi:hypothetical protein
VTTPERPPPRAHHLQFKYQLVEIALTNGPAFVELCASEDKLAALWNDVGANTVEAERCDGTPRAQNVGDAQRPVLMITMPPPERPNEAYFLCAFPKAARLDDKGGMWVPDPDGPLELRIFGMERSMLPDGGLIGFVVEWTPVYRHNYDAPDNGSPGAFWKAILEVVGGTRASVHSTAISPSNARHES